MHLQLDDVSTHSRAKAAAGKLCAIPNGDRPVSTHSRAKAAALEVELASWQYKVSTHSRAKAAAPYIKK